jgi:PAS domain S-box-containing protein
MLQWIVGTALLVCFVAGSAAVILLRLNRRLKHEVAERKQMEADLRDSEDYMRSIFRVAPAGIGVVVDRVMQVVNPRLCEMLGYTKEELAGQSSTMLYPSQEEFDYVGQEKYRQIAEGGTGIVETRMLRKDGSIIFVLLASTPIDIDDHSKGVTFTTLDISDRKQAEEKLLESNKRLMGILDSIPADIYVSDMQTFEILYMNAHMKTSFGEDFTGQLCWKVFRNGNGPCAHCSNPILLDLEGLPVQLRVWEGENPITKNIYLNHDRAMQWIDERYVRIQIAIDITDMKKANQAVKASLLEKETLLQEIHHRVKNNMAVIGSLLRLQSSNTDDLVIKNALRDSQNRIYAMAAVHESLYGSESLASVAIKPYLTKISNVLFQAYSVTSNRIRLKIESDEFELNADKASPLGLALNELITNSLKYAFPDDRKGEISVSLKKQGQELEITVADDGVGFPECLDWKQTSSLGTQLVRTLVEDQLDGTIALKEGQGTRFVINLPNMG